MKSTHTPLVLVILDGWGYQDNSEHNAIACAKTPNWDRWWQDYPHTLLECSGGAVGLPAGQMGNSEVGHMHMGAGRILEQDYTRICDAIAAGQLAENAVLQTAIDHAKQNDKAIHVLGLLSPGGVHSHEQHIQAACRTIATQGVQRLFVHAFLDGRDTPPRSAESSLKTLQDHLQQQNCGQIASICGRYFAMDRDKRWARTQTAYDMLSNNIAPFHATDAITALHNAYARNENDEFVQPTLISSAEPSNIQDGDVVIFMNFRADRARQLSQALTVTDFNGFNRRTIFKQLHFVTVTKYSTDLDAQIMFPQQTIENTLGECLAAQEYHQLRIAETEKYAHVTSFFNGGQETPFAHEDRLLIPSPKITTYDLQPEMSAPQVTTALIQAIKDQQHEVIICNFANADMVGHSGNFAATVKAIECIDQCLGEIAAAIDRVDGEMIITADHGNAEKMFDENSEQAHTAHTSSPIPFLYLGTRATINTPLGSLTGVSPTLLYLLGLDKPNQMTGNSLLTFNENG